MTANFRSFSIRFLGISLVSLMTMGSLQAQEAQKDKGKALMETTHQTITQEKHHFEPNKGQIADHDGNVLNELEYVYRAPGMKLGLTKNGFHYNLYTVQEKQQVSEATGKPAQKPKSKLKEKEKQRNLTYHYHRVEVNFKGANENPEIIAEQKTDYYANYYLAHCPEGITNVHSYRKLTYKNLYDNIDLVLTPQQNEEGKPSLKYNIRVRPGGDLSDVKMAYKGMDGLSLKDGQLTVKTSEGQLKESIPASFWAGSRESVEVDYNVKGNVVSFKTVAGQAERQKTLVVDPSLSWSTYLGGSEGDRGEAIITDASGNVYVTGWTQASDFPTTSGAYQESYKGFGDAFLSKFSNSNSLTWSTYLGGRDFDEGNGLTTDGSGNVYVTGEADTAFPTTRGAYQESFGGDWDVFLSKFTSSGSLTWSTYLGGSREDEGRGVTTDGSGNVYVTGAADTAFPTTSGAYQESFGGGQYDDYDAFLSKFTSSGSLSWSTYLGGSFEDDGHGVTTDGSGNVYVTGDAESGFPTTSGAYQESYEGFFDAFLSKFTSSGSLTWSTYLGGSEGDEGKGVTTDDNGNVYVTGYTEGSGFPTTILVFQSSHEGSNDAFLSKFTSSGSLTWSTYLGGSREDEGRGVTTDGSGNVYVTGEADTTFPTTSGAYQESYGGGFGDAFLSKFNGSGSLSWSTFLGGRYEDIGYGVTTDGSGNVYVTGEADTLFPTTRGAYQESFGGDSDAFLSKFDTTTNDPCSPSVTKNGATLEANASDATYQWLDCDNGYAEVSGATSRSFTPTANGNYAVEVTQNNCTDTSSCYQVEATGIGSKNSKGGFEIYPNPAADQLTIVQQDNVKPQTFQLQTLTGKRLKTGRLSGTKRIDVSKLSPGFYLLKVHGDDFVRTKKVVVK